MALLPSALSYLGIAKEATLGTAVVPTNFLRVDTFGAVENVDYLADEAYRGSMAKTYDQIQGNKSITYSAGGPLRVGDIGWLLSGLCNDVVVTGSADPYTHVFALLNSGTGQPTSFTLTDWDGNSARAFAGCMVQDLTITYQVGGGGGNSGLATWSATWQGMSSASAATPTPSFSADRATASWAATVSLGGVASYIVPSLSVTIKRTVEPLFSLSGAQTPSSMSVDGDLEVTGSTTVLFDSSTGSTVHNLYRNGTTVALVVDLVDPNAVTHEIKLQMSQVQLDQATKMRPAGSRAELDCNFTGQANATDVGASAGFSPIKATVKNALPSGTFK